MINCDAGCITRCPQCGFRPVFLPNHIGPGGYSDQFPEICVLYKFYGFCSYGFDCDYEHPENFELFLGHENSIHSRDCIPLELNRIHPLICMLNCEVLDRERSGVAKCKICREATPNGSVTTAPVGETYAAPLCPHCGTDYSRYKSLIDRATEQIHHTLRIPLRYEAHRWGTSRFGWSLFNKKNGFDVLKFIFSEKIDSCEHCLKVDYKKLRRIISMGAGRGCTEHVLEEVRRENFAQLLHEIIAFDTTRSVHHQKEFLIPIRYGTPQLLIDATLFPTGCSILQDTILLMCWPPFGSQLNNESTMAFDTLRNFAEQGGLIFIYIGDPSATGDWRFHELLMSHWIEMQEFKSEVDRWNPIEMGLLFAGNDRVAIYVRRQTPLSLPPVQWVLQR